MCRWLQGPWEVGQPVSQATGFSVLSNGQWNSPDSVNALIFTFPNDPWLLWGGYKGYAYEHMWSKKYIWTTKFNKMNRCVNGLIHSAQAYKIAVQEQKIGAGILDIGGKGGSRWSCIILHWSWIWVLLYLNCTLMIELNFSRSDALKWANIILDY